MILEYPEIGFAEQSGKRQIIEKPARKRAGSP
jgi:hypothetical protein